ncbi:E3 ubiquitin-protein ligase GW2 isoform X2 [Hordeum vulgare subsp. vulgare]|uniref:E3 ubiquitin-protein ligase GW2 isoform X2 n=1 Tax=Hordeum vulgare subsp. vulgare TaxID=112509 RepID=UPI001D1A4A50|nr:E3 ubiquitin-protein ligase GW2 isoform X2 [Hordeum vulgare subsp. vulgare]
MGNRIGGRRKAGVEERYTRPQGLYEHRDIDQKKLRKLILEAKLAPCYPGADDAAGADLEECPICFLYYPSLNRSKCCSKGICTECFLQMKPTHTARPTQCPFCKTPNYAVEYRGVKTKEERSIEQFEEQKVIEAQMRMRQQALQDEEDKMRRKQSRCSSSRTIAPTTEVEYRDICSTSYSAPPYRCTEQETECCSSEPSCSAQANMRSFHSRHTRGPSHVFLLDQQSRGGIRTVAVSNHLVFDHVLNNAFHDILLVVRKSVSDGNIDMNIEDMMVMEAIWRSIQEQGSIGNPACGSFMPFEQPTRERQAFVAASPLEIPHPGGFSCAVAAMTEHQPSSMDFSYMTGSSAFPVFDMFRRPCNIAGGSLRAVESSLDSWSGIAPSGTRREMVREEGECSIDHWSEGAEAGTSYAGSDIMADAGTMPPLPFADNYSMAASHFRPESIEEQMMYSMAVSLAEAHGRTHTQGLTWL